MICIKYEIGVHTDLYIFMSRPIQLARCSENFNDTLINIFPGADDRKMHVYEGMNFRVEADSGRF